MGDGDGLDWCSGFTGHHTTSFSCVFLALQGVIFILAGFRVSKAALRAARLAREKHAPVVVVVGKREELVDGSWKQFAEWIGERGFAVDLYQSVFDVDRNEVLLCHGDILQAEPKDPFVPEHAADSGLCPGYGPGSYGADHSLRLAI